MFVVVVVSLQEHHLLLPARRLLLLHLCNLFINALVMHCSTSFTLASVFAIILATAAIFSEVGLGPLLSLLLLLALSVGSAYSSKTQHAFLIAPLAILPRHFEFIKCKKKEAPLGALSIPSRSGDAHGFLQLAKRETNTNYQIASPVKAGRR